MEKWAIYAYVAAVIVICCLIEMSLAMDEEAIQKPVVSYHRSSPNKTVNLKLEVCLTSTCKQSKVEDHLVKLLFNSLDSLA